MTKEEREQEIQHAMDFFCDLVPYDAPDYSEQVRKMAEAYVDGMYDNP